MKRKIMIAAGGTGGHIYPALSIIEYLREFKSECEILFVGTPQGPEREFVKKLDISFIPVKASGISVSGGFVKKLKSFISFFINLVSGFATSLRVVGSFKPGIVLGMGGYVCAPVFLAAIFLGKNIAIHEQNYLPGRLNRFFARFSRFIFISFKDSEKYFKQAKCIRRDCEIIYTGNPIRKSVWQFYSLKPDYERWHLEKSRKTVAAFGGSLGAEKLNNCVLSLYELLKRDRGFQVILICGKRYYDIFTRRLNEITGPADNLIFRLYPYVEEMEQLYAVADIIISRAGATTVAELDYTKIPAILVPYPEAVENHQFYNADYLVRENTATLILDKDLTPDLLLSEIKRLAVIPPLRNKLAGNRAGHEFINAAALISDKITGII